MTISRNFSLSWDLKIQISLLRVTILISSSSLFFQKRSVLWQVWLLHQGYIAEPSAGSAAAVARKNWHYFPSLHARPIERTHHRRQRSAKVEIFRFPGRQTNNYPDPRLLGWECKYDDVGICSQHFWATLKQLSESISNPFASGNATVHWNESEQRLRFEQLKFDHVTTLGWVWKKLCCVGDWLGVAGKHC